MFLQKLILINFKNYENTEIEFSPDINCFIGNNGVGKTNLLDAIYYLSLCKSYFTSIDTQNILYNREFFTIQGVYELKGEKEDIYCGVVKNKKKVFRRNKKEYDRLADHIGLIPVVMISPFDSSLVLEGSEERRNFINSVISQYDHEYLHNLLRYNKALQQRNKLLKDFAVQGKIDKDVLSIYDEQLINNGTPIYKIRQQFIDQFLPVFNDYYKLIAGHEKAELIYRSQLQTHSMKKLLDQSLTKDIALEYTTAGIHKDDLQMQLNGHPLKISGSQGQQKTFLTALKFAQFDFLKKINQVKPILLLDDIFDKFDSHRVEQIIRLVAKENFGQIFITDTNKVRLDEILKKIDSDHRIFMVNNGEVIKI